MIGKEAGGTKSINKYVKNAFKVRLTLVLELSVAKFGHLTAYALKIK